MIFHPISLFCIWNKRKPGNYISLVYWMLHGGSGFSWRLWHNDKTSFFYESSYFNILSFQQYFYALSYHIWICCHRDLSHNHFTGDLPSSFGTLKNLTRLWVLFSLVLLYFGVLTVSAVISSCWLASSHKAIFVYLQVLAE